MRLTLLLRAFPLLTRQYKSSTCRSLNRILFDVTECQNTLQEIKHDKIEIKVVLDGDDYRAKHIKQVLKLECGRNFRSGLLNIGLTNEASVLSYDNDNKVSVSLGQYSQLIQVEKPIVSLVLAVPRPTRFEQILFASSCIGVDKVFIIAADKVAKEYYGSSLLVSPYKMRPSMILALQQAETDYHLPEVVCLHKRPGKLSYGEYINGVCEKILNSDDGEAQGGNGEKKLLTIFLHPEFPILRSPQGEYDLPSSCRLSQLLNDIFSATPEIVEDNKVVMEERKEYREYRESLTKGNLRVCLVIGPDEGWSYEEARAWLGRDKNFDENKKQGSVGVDTQKENLFGRGKGVHLGARILRTDLAVQTALSVTHELVHWHKQRLTNMTTEKI